MRISDSTFTRSVAIFLAVFFVPGLSIATEQDDIAHLLKDFLAGVDTADAHDRFWADDLVYTSSSGTRTDKDSIMAGFAESEAGEEDSTSPSYTAENVQIKLYGTTAIVAFRLVASTPGQAQQNYLNTGTLLKRNGTWQVVAWQATHVPD